MDEATATPGPPISGVLIDGDKFKLNAAIYLNGLKITGGTGRFKGARGNLNLLFGAGDSVSGKFIFRYQGQICFAQPED